MAEITDQQILERIKKVVEDILKAAPEKITAETRYIDDLGADSLDTVTLLMALEEEFGESISDEEAKELTTVQATIGFIRKKLETKAA